MKRIQTFLLLLLVFAASEVYSQGIVIHMKDGTTVTYSSTSIEKISVVSSDEGRIFGKWHLGFWKAGSYIIHFDGSEYMLFLGTDLTWAGRQDGQGTYKIAYAADNNSFVATNTAQEDDVSEWTIVKYTDRMLVLRSGGAERYFYPSQEEAKNAMMEINPTDHAESSDIETILSYATGHTKSEQTPMGQHFENRHVTTSDDKAWLLDPDNEPTPIAGLSQWIEKTVNLYPFGEPVPADINQHVIGDCSACSVFASLAYLYPDFIKHIIKDNGNNTYTVSMYDPQGNTVDVCVSNKVLCDYYGTIGQVTGKNNAVNWATILEKAVMKWEQLYCVDAVEGIGTEFVAPLLTGCGDSFAYAPNSLYTSELKAIAEWALNNGMITIGGFNVGGLKCGVLETVTAHAFTYMLSNNPSSIFAMRNPWGIESVDGVLEIPDERTIVQTIDARIVYPGAAAPYLRKNIGPYTPPVFRRFKTDIGVAARLKNRVVNLSKPYELW